MTEDEATTKWCPFVRYVSESLPEGYASGNKFAYVEDTHTNCMASDCMMWRWDFKNLSIENARKNKRQGYGGLAGNV